MQVLVLLSRVVMVLGPNSPYWPMAEARDVINKF